ncbi:MAG: murein biosynthesis integral membrane protein MurJ [Planctomycetaceae bacterium]|nr:murein biosynthesis integral membrane protein MurJ [Planctomycetaceae bacterium]
MTQEQSGTAESDKHLAAGRRRKTLRGTLVVAAGSLFSRFLGMLRDVVTAGSLGMSVGGTMDAFVLAFRLPDVARRFFGDGSLGISFIPIFGRVWHKDRQKAAALLTAILCRFFVYLTGFVCIGEILCWTGIRFFHPDGKVYITAQLLSLLLPYLILICMAAICSAALQTQDNFSVSTFVPPILNVIWLAGILVVVPLYSHFQGTALDPDKRCYILTLCILTAGFIQLLIHFPFLKASGFRFDFHFASVKSEIRQTFHRFLPQVFGLMTVQVNLLVASAAAWLFSGTAGTPIYWLNNVMTYPLRPGAAAAIYYSERLFEFPQGLIGFAVATAFYPLMARNAARKHYKALGEDLTLGLRLQFAFSIPAGAALMLMSEKLAHLLFQRGAFNACDTIRTADMIFWFGTGVWAFCTLPVIIRAFYILGNNKTPFWAAAGSIVLNLLLALFLMCWMREQGFALAASIAAGVQAAGLLFYFSLRYKMLNVKALVLCILRSLTATACMTLAVAVVMKSLPGSSSLDDFLHITLGGVIGLAVFLFVLRLLGGREPEILLHGKITSQRRQLTKKNE